LNVAEIVDTMCLLGIGEANQPQLEKDIALKYLNLVHAELYRKTAIFNTDAISHEELTSVAGESTVVLSRIPHAISTIIVQGQPKELTGIGRLKFLKNKILNPNSGNPCYYTYDLEDISFWPILPNSVYVMDVLFIIPWGPFDYDTLESDIPYPPLFHSILVDGGLTYLYQDEGGFRTADKVKKTEERWKDGKAEILSYFYGSTKQSIGTYSNL
jgi:hypothetical protein